jgi:hypothetical protein
MKTLIIVLLSSVASVLTFAQNISDINCKLWKPTSFCDNVPISIYPDSAHATDCYWKEITCEQMNKKKNLVGVILTFKNEVNNTIEYKTKFNNFKIKDKNGRDSHPTAMAYSAKLVKDGKTISEVKYLTKLKVKKYENYWKAGSTTDIILLFPNAVKGDKLIIDNFIETEIQ